MSDERNWDRMIVVAATHGERIHGWLRKDVDTRVTESFDMYMQACCANRTPVPIMNARNLVGQKDVRVDPQGNFLGIVPMLALMPVDMFMGPIEEYHVIPSSWYFPGRIEGARKIMDKLLEVTEANELRSRAAAAGIQSVQPVPPRIVPRGH